MPHPAISIDSRLYTIPEMRYKSSASDPWSDWFAISGDVPMRRKEQYVAASTSNPVRPDGTRAPRGWFRSGYDVTVSGMEERITTFTHTSGQMRQYRAVIPSPAVPVDVLSHNEGTVASARIKALASYSERAVQYSAALLQVGQTARMVGDLSKGFCSELFTLLETKGRRSDWMRRSLWKKLPGWYLEYLYGWKPLADDITNVVDELLVAKFHDETLHMVLKGKASATDEFVREEAIWNGIARIKSTWQRKTHTKVCYRYDIPQTALEYVQPTGFFGGLWELTPFSFVLDWALPIGDWLTAIEAESLRYFFKEGCVSTIARSSPSETRLYAPDGNWSLSSSGKVEITQVVKAHAFSRYLEVPSVLLSRIPFKNPLSLNHAAQGLALLTQVIKGDRIRH